LLYLAARRGYRAGGSNGPANPSFAPEYVNDLELGIKSDWQVENIPFRTNAALYYQKYRDIQVQDTTFNNGAPVILTANAAAARLWGAELDALAQLTDDLQVGINFDFLNFRYTAFDPGVNAQPLIAARTVNRPPYKYGVNARYHLPLPARVGDVSVRANWAWQDSSGDVSQAGGVIHAYGLLNVAGDWDRIGNTSLDVSLFASNVTNKLYSIGGITVYNSLGFAVQRFGEPRMYGIRLRYRFEARNRH
jgi:iron complex outermembrane receptor protein